MQHRTQKPWSRTENFSKLLHLLWDLGLIQRFLTKREDILVFLAMLRYSDFRTGECVVFIGKLVHEAGLKHATQVQRIQRKIERMGAFWQPRGKKGYKKVNGNWAKRYYRSSGKEIIAHALNNGLISDEKMAEIEIRQAEGLIAAEAASYCVSSVNDLSTPETVEEIIEADASGRQA